MIKIGKEPKFVMSKDKKGEWRFKLVAPNGKVICVSEGYTRKLNCIKGINSVIWNSDDAEIVEK